jgi:ABC-type glycerol-3-phosphate transport system permease component
MVYPLIYMVITSFRSNNGSSSGGEFSLSTWETLFGTTPLAGELVNSAVITASALVLIVSFASAAGFAFAKLPFRGHSAALLAIVACMMVPVQAVIVPLYSNFARLHLINNYVSAILVYAAFGMPFGVFLMTSFFRGIPDELVDAALCDGAGHLRTFWWVALPLARPAIASVAVLQFILIWNDLLVGLLFLQTPEKRTITVGLGVLSSGHLSSLPLLMAGSVLSAAPALIVYAFFQRHLIAGLTVGVSR